MPFYHSHFILYCISGPTVQYCSLPLYTASYLPPWAGRLPPYRLGGCRFWAPPACLEIPVLPLLEPLPPVPPLLRLPPAPSAVPPPPPPFHWAHRWEPAVTACLPPAGWRWVAAWDTCTTMPLVLGIYIFLLTFLPFSVSPFLGAGPPAYLPVSAPFLELRNTCHWVWDYCSDFCWNLGFLPFWNTLDTCSL